MYCLALYFTFLQHDEAIGAIPLAGYTLSLPTEECEIECKTINFLITNQMSVIADQSSVVRTNPLLLQIFPSTDLWFMYQYLG